jgi:hypothetical protein
LVTDFFAPVFARKNLLSETLNNGLLYIVAQKSFVPNLPGLPNLAGF